MARQSEGEHNRLCSRRKGDEGALLSNDTRDAAESFGETLENILGGRERNVPSGEMVPRAQTSHSTFLMVGVWREQSIIRRTIALLG